jgi:hypothetical protein
MEKITAIRRLHLTVHSRSLNPCGVCWGTSFSRTWFKLLVTAPG